MRLSPLPVVITCDKQSLYCQTCVKILSFQVICAAQEVKAGWKGFAFAFTDRHLVFFVCFFLVDLLASFPLFSSPSLDPRKAHCSLKHTNCSYSFTCTQYFWSWMCSHSITSSSPLSFNVWTPLADVYWLSSRVILISRICYRSSSS